MEKKIKTLIIGLGNELLCDEGVGVHAVRILKEQDLPVGTVILELGTAILDAIPFIEMAEQVIIIDAMNGKDSPGTIYQSIIEDSFNDNILTAMHSFDIKGVLALTEKADDLPVTILGVEPQTINWSLELSPVVHDAMDPLINKVLSLI